MRYVILVVIGLVLAVGVSMLVGSNVGKKEEVVDDSNFVLVARQNLAPGSFIIVNNHIGFVPMEDKKVKPNFIRKKDVNIAELEGAVVRNLVKSGEPLEKEKIVTPKEGGFLSAVLYPGKRAVSVGVDVVSANAGFIFPGDKVDLLLTHQINTPEGKRSFATETFVEGVRVLAIDQQVSNLEGKALIPKTVTLEVTPKQAEEVLVADELGKISLILRSSGAAATAESEPRDKSFTRDNEVSRMIDEYRPMNNHNVDVTITRGKNTTETRIVGTSREVPQAQEQLNPNQERPQ